MASETASYFVYPADLVLENRNSSVYPYTVVADDILPNGGRFVGVASVDHPTTSDPNGPGGWQFAPLKHVFEVAIPPQSEQRCTVLIEGNKSRRLKVVQGMNLEQAVRAESECGMAVVQACSQEQEVDTWDMLGGDELDAWLRQYIDPTSPMPDEFRQSWESASEFAEWVYALMYNRIHLMQWLRHYQGGTYLGNPHDYTLDRLLVHGVPKMVKNYQDQGLPIDTSRVRVEQIHIQVCQDAGVATESLPFDPLKAHALGKKPEDYERVYYACLGVTSDNYFAGYNKMPRVASTGSIIIREGQMVKVINDYLQLGSVVAVGGGQHIRNATKAMVEKGRIPVGSLKWYIGAAACSAFPLNWQSHLSAE